ncbi:MATE family efflux transporter [Paraprevotella clara]|uniref:MATE family efflux transporter n=1 Tax=Paraprevotella clara TaxID=454154 RepID=UPI003AB56F6F
MTVMNKSYHKEILHIALPSILSNITVPLLGLIDLTIAGHLGAASYIGAIAIGGTIFNMIYWIFAFLRMGTSGMTSQAYGADNKQEIQLLLYRSLATSTGIAILILLLQGPLLHLALSVMSPTEAVADFASVYFRICVWGAPAVLGLYSLTGWFIGLQNAKYPLYVAIVQNLVNIAASLSFVFVWHMDVAGVALGTVIAQYCGLTLSLYYCHRMHRRLGLPYTFVPSSVFQKNAIRRFFSVNRDIFLRTLCLVCVTLYFTSAGSRQGEYILAANALLMQYFTLYSYFMDGFAFAGEALSGKCAGAGDYQALKKVIRNLFLWGSGVALTFTLFYMAGGKALMNLLTNEASVVATTSDYLPWAVLIPFAGLSAFIWDGVFIGLTATRYMLLSMLGATLTFFSVYLSLFPIWQNHALWLAFLLYLFVRGLMQHLLYRNKILTLHPTN